MFVEKARSDAFEQRGSKEDVMGKETTKETLRNYTRREILKSAAAVAAGAATVGLVGCSGSDQAGKEDAWDYETDVVVIGFGGAGGATAVTAADNDAEVIVIERDKYEERLSNTRMSNAIFHSPDPSGDFEGLKQYIRAMFSGENLEDKTEPEQSPLFVDGIVENFAEYMLTNKDFVLSLDPDLKVLDYGGAAFPDFPGAESSKYQTYTPSYSGSPLNQDFPNNEVPKDEVANGLALMFAFEYAVEQRADKVTLMWETKGDKLVQDESGMVIGIEAFQGDEKIRIKARKGVVLTSGGYEYNVEMRRAFLEGPGITGWAFYGTPSNEGIGIRMAVEAGAQLAKVGKAASRFIFACPDVSFNGLLAGSITDGAGTQGTFCVNAEGKRFMDETLITRDPSRYFSYKEAVKMDITTLEFPNIPAYLIMDEPRRLERPICALDESTCAWGIIPWDRENSVPVEKGWMYKADTFEELAEIIRTKHDLNKGRMKAENLVAAAEQYREVTETGVDPAFGRELRKSEKEWVPVATPPFYALPLVAGGPNTKGGLQADGDRHVIDWDNEVIPHLYTAGEISSCFKFVYQAGGNITECLVCGRIAGERVAAEKAWDEQ